MNALITAHLVGACLWVTGILVGERLLAYHAEEPPSARPTLVRIEARVERLFVWPGLLLVLGAGLAALQMLGFDWLRVSLWMQAKLGLMVVLVLVQLGLRRRRRVVAAQDPNHALQKGGRGATYVLVLILVTGMLALSVHRPLVGGG